MGSLSRACLAFGSAAAELALSVLAPPRCAACDAPVAMRTVFCAACASTVQRIASDGRVVAAFAFGGAVGDAIVRFKYASRPDLARPLGNLIAAAVRDAIGGEAIECSRIDVVVPVPLHPRRLL